MATKTDNLKLSKAETSDGIKSTLTANNNNFDKLDGVITRLRNNQLRGVVSGTEIEINDAGEVESVLHISGNSEQNSRSGKNVLSTLVLTTEVTTNGITFTPVFDDSSNLLYINVNGTATEKITQLISTFVPNLNVEYKVNGCPTGGTTETAHVYVTGGITVVTGADKNATWTTEGNKGYHIIVANGAKITNMRFYPMIRLATVTDSSYEPYGLQPSLEFEGSIKSIKSKSDNILYIDELNEAFSLNGLAFTPYPNGSIRINGTSNAITSVRLTNKLLEKLNVGQTYTGSIGRPINGVSLLVEEAKGGSFVATISDKPTWTFSGLSTGDSVRASILIKSGVTVNAIIFPIINKGNEALPFHPFGYNPIETKVYNGNFFNVDEWEAFDKQPDGSYLSNRVLRSHNSQLYVDLPVDVYTISYLIKSDASVDSRYRLAVKYKDGTESAANTWSIGEYVEASFTTLAKKIDYFFITYNLGASNTYIKNLMMNRGPVKKAYVPYDDKKVLLQLGDIELCSAPGGARDTIRRINGKWNFVNKVRHQIFNGNEFSHVFLNSDGTNIGRALATDVNYGNSTVKDIISNKFIGKDYSGLYGNQGKGFFIALANGTSAGSNRIFITFDHSKLTITTLEGLQEWIKSIGGFEAVFLLSEPIYTPIVEQGLISALDELEDLILHKGYNFIEVKSPNGVRAHLDLSYYKDINIVLDNINASLLGLGGGASV